VALRGPGSVSMLECKLGGSRVYNLFQLIVLELVNLNCICSLSGKRLMLYVYKRLGVVVSSQRLSFVVILHMSNVESKVKEVVLLFWCVMVLVLSAILAMSLLN